ncbi:hypothetical protein U8527_00385 [Kordia algicida OT-1]|uniref:Uncharacterized protein n=1 Tax=Kordia algicida OT-1 TaxID=391587 RepID=A9DR61_9FLAO|nr:hypothetical protein [Kordia algicida]EDP96746.1 hypothetical protein KAOT1_16323 [Kordia algicida OT-1]
MKFYHYTPTIRLKEIIESKEIKLATQSVFNKKEKPVAWVSTNPNWENTATKMVSTIFGKPRQLTFEEQAENLGCARIEVKSTGLMTWAKLKHKANMDLKAARAFEFTGKQKKANPNEWFGSLTPIKNDRWIKIEVFENGKWQEFKTSK